jgi:3-oxoadipate enol-lactonase
MTATESTPVSLEGTALDIYVDGNPDGEPLLLLHPWFGCWRFWLTTTELLPERRCIMPDLYSVSYGSWEPYATPQGLVTAVLATMDQLAIERTDLIGSSLGGVVAQLLAIDHPDRVGRLVLVGTGPYTSGASPLFTAEVGKWIDDPAAARRLGAARPVAVVTHHEVDPDEFAACVDMVEAADPQYVGSVLKSARELDLRPKLPRITAPTLVVRGSFDPIRTREHSDALVTGIPDARQVEMEGAGHAPYVDDPETFVAELRRFFGS